MMRRRYNNRIVMALLAATVLASCQTVKMPKINDIMKSPEFREDASNIGNEYPDMNDAPSAPTDVRSDKQWDKDARRLQALRDKKDNIPMEAGPSEAEARRQFESLKAKVQAYKKDDPASGPVQGMPSYKPRR